MSDERSPQSWRVRYRLFLAAGILLVAGIVIDAVRHGVTVFDIGAGIGGLCFIALGLRRMINIRRHGRP